LWKRPDFANGPTRTAGAGDDRKKSQDQHGAGHQSAGVQAGQGPPGTVMAKETDYDARRMFPELASKK